MLRTSNLNSKTNLEAWYSAVSSDHDTRTTSSNHDSPILGLSESARLEELPKPLVTAMEQELPAPQTIKQHYCRAADYRTYRLANHSSRYKKSLSSYIYEMVKMVRTQMKSHFFAPNDQIPSLASSLHYKRRAIPTTFIMERQGRFPLSL